MNEGQTKYFISSSKTPQRNEKCKTFGDYNFEVVKDFVCLGVRFTNNNELGSEIKRRTTLANRCYFGLGKQLRSKSLSRRTILQKSLILPILLYGAETWTINRSDESLLAVSERKILHQNNFPIRVDDGHRFNHAFQIQANTLARICLANG